ncbi:hypothetical protein BJ165DRAFT_1531021 [Panaeolus papilionaceus]|nr:hypothetical protein BJ165DRAFT_1531021 [Panaeolus papilionaceus]
MKHSHKTGDDHGPNAASAFPNEPQRQLRSYLEQRNLASPPPPLPSPSPSPCVSQDTLMEHSEYNDSQVTLRPPPTANKRWRVKVKGLLIPHVNTSPKTRSAPTSPSVSSRWRISRDFSSKRKSLTQAVDIPSAVPASSARSSGAFDFFLESPPVEKDDEYDTPPSSPGTPISPPISPRTKRRPLKVSTTVVLRREVERSKTPITPSRSASKRQRKSILLPDEDIWVKAIQMTPATPTPTSPMTLSRSSVNVDSGSITANLPQRIDRPVDHVARQHASLWTLVFLTGAGYLMVAMLVTLCVIVGIYRGANRGATELVSCVRDYRDRKRAVEVKGG